MDEMTTTRAARAASFAAAVFVVRLVTFFVPALRDATAGNARVVAELICLLAIAPHLLLFPVVAALRAPVWARHAGYGWLVIDMATDIMALNGVAAPAYLSLKYGGHIAAAIWIASASWQARGGMRSAGLLAALHLGGYSFVASFVPPVALAPSLILLPTWITLAGRRIARRDVRAAMPAASEHVTLDEHPGVDGARRAAITA